MVAADCVRASPARSRLVGKYRRWPTQSAVRWTPARGLRSALDNAAGRQALARPSRPEELPADQVVEPARRASSAFGIPANPAPRPAWPPAYRAAAAWYDQAGGVAAQPQSRGVAKRSEYCLPPPCAAPCLHVADRPRSGRHRAARIVVSAQCASGTNGRGAAQPEQSVLVDRLHLVQAPGSRGGSEARRHEASLAGSPHSSPPTHLRSR